MKVIVIAATAGLLGSAAAGVLTARAGGEAPIPVPRDFTRLIPPYPHAHYFAAGDDLHVDGATRFMAYAETDDSPERALQRYTDMFGGRGLAVAHFPDALVATSPDDDWRRTIVVTPRENGSLIVASVSQTKPNRARAHVPVPPVCTVTESTGSHDAGIVRENVQLACEALKRDVVVFYDGLMGEPSQVLTSDDERTQAITYERDREHMTLVVTQLRDAETPTAVAALHWEAR
jgi:hypothetical protein